MLLQNVAVVPILLPQNTAAVQLENRQFLIVDAILDVGFDAIDPAQPIKVELMIDICALVLPSAVDLCPINKQFLTVVESATPLVPKKFTPLAPLLKMQESIVAFTACPEGQEIYRTSLFVDVPLASIKHFLNCIF